MPNRYGLVSYPINGELLEEVLAVPLKPTKDGSGHGGEGYKNGWVQGLTMARIRDFATYPQIRFAIEPLRFLMPYFKVYQVLVNRLDGHTKLDVHRDGHSLNYRFHLPIVTTPLVYWWDQITHEHIHMPEGLWHGPMPYSGVLHQMHNNGDGPRYHLVVDMIPPK